MQHQEEDTQFTEGQEEEYDYNNFSENHFSSVRNPESQGY